MDTHLKPVTKSVSSEWVWFDRFAGLKTTFYVAIPEGRSIEVGVGFAPQGIPRGTRKLLAKSTMLTFYGFSSIYAKAADHNGLCQVSIFQNIDPNNLPEDVGF